MRAGRGRCWRCRCRGSVRGRPSCSWRRPGLAAAADAASVPALAWSPFAVGRRLLIAMNDGETEQHVIDVCVAAPVRVAGAAELLGSPDAEL